MEKKPGLPYRRSVRWRGYDYSLVGAYFVTICTQDHRCLLGKVEDGQMRPSDSGRMVKAAWDQIPVRFPEARLDEFVVMPNHMHGIMQIGVGAPLVGARDVDQSLNRAGTRPAPTSGGGAFADRAATRAAPTLGSIVGAFKSITTNQYILGIQNQTWPGFRKSFWQRNYYEHVIRDQVELEKIREYIRHNPLLWTTDRYNPEKGVLVMDETGRTMTWDQS